MHQMNLDIRIEALVTDYERGVMSAIETNVHDMAVIFITGRHFMLKFEIWAFRFITAEISINR